MSRDSSHHQIHLHAPHHADLFEEFTRPPSLPTHPSLSHTSTSHSLNPTHASTTHPNPPNPHSAQPDNGVGQHLQGSFLPYEEILLPQELMPVNPEDEDGVVPDMHAAFGINAALNQGGVMNGTVSAGGSGGGQGQGQGQGGGGGGGGGMGERSTAGLAREGVWRDLGMERILDGEVGGGERVARGSVGGAMGKGVTGARREGRRTGVLLLR